MSVRFQTYSFIKGIHDQRIVIVIADLVSYDPTIIEIQNGAQIYFVNFHTDIILKLCYIGQPFIIWGICMEIPVQVILCDVCWSTAAFGAVLRFPFDRGLDMFFSADT